jgi:hypothetical protein
MLMHMARTDHWLSDRMADVAPLERRSDARYPSRTRCDPAMLDTVVLCTETLSLAS